MGTSHPESRGWVIRKIRQNKVTSILDVGAGSGTYFNALKKNGYTRAHIDAIEVWNPYIEEFNLKNKYDNVYQEDVRDWNDFNYDLVIFGDILEHMSKDEAIEVWDKVSKSAKYAVISIPIIHYHQGEINGNPYERHVKDDWTHSEVIDTFSGIIDSWEGTVVGAFWAEFR
jgi:SAM-dependent methyltransferase